MDSTAPFFGRIKSVVNGENGMPFEFAPSSGSIVSLSSSSNDSQSVGATGRRLRDTTEFRKSDVLFGRGGASFEGSERPTRKTETISL
jgi:hypothetical protein